MASVAAVSAMGMSAGKHWSKSQPGHLHLHTGALLAPATIQIFLFVKNISMFEESIENIYIGNVQIQKYIFIPLFKFLRGHFLEYNFWQELHKRWME